MKYLYFDIECCDGKNICSLGYVLVNKRFKILKKDDIIINPEKPFKLNNRKGVPYIELAYKENIFLNAPNFKEKYQEIKSLLTHRNVILVGHSVRSDLHYINRACDRYSLEKLELSAYDTQEVYKKIKSKGAKSLGSIADDLGIDLHSLRLHKSCDDAELTMLVMKNICKELELSPNAVLSVVPDCSFNSVAIDKHRKPQIA